MNKNGMAQAMRNVCRQATRSKPKAKLPIFSPKRFGGKHWMPGQEATPATAIDREAGSVVGTSLR